MQEENASPLREGAIMAHEMYEELRNAGFKRRDALELLAKMMTGAIGAGMESDD